MTKILHCISYEKIGQQLFEILEEGLEDDAKVAVVKDIVDRTSELQESIEQLFNDRLDALQSDTLKRYEQTAQVIALAIHMELRRRNIPAAADTLSQIAVNSVSDAPSNIAQA